MVSFASAALKRQGFRARRVNSDKMEKYYTILDTLGNKLIFVEIIAKMHKIRHNYGYVFYILTARGVLLRCNKQYLLI